MKLLVDSEEIMFKIFFNLKGALNHHLVGLVWYQKCNSLVYFKS